MADYTVDQYRAAAKRALEAGNVESAKRLIAAGRDLQAQQGLRGERAGSGFDAAMHGARQGITFGFGDEIFAGARAAGDWLRGQDFGAAYDKRLADERGMLEQARAENPTASMAGEFAGGVLPGVATGGAGLLASGGRAMGARMLAGAAGGAAGGGLYGFGSGEGGAGERLQSAATGAAIGAGAGAAMPPLVGAASKVARPVVDIAGSILGVGADRRAQRALAKTIERSGRSIDDISDDVARAAREGQDTYRTVDALGHAGQRQLAGITRAPGDARQEIVDFLESRQAGQGERLSSAVSDAFGFGGQPGAGPVLSGAQRSARGADEALRAHRSAKAKVEYEAAEGVAGPVNLNDALGVIDKTLGRDPILGDTALSKGEMGRRLASLRDRLQKGGEQLIDFREVLAIKKDLYRTMQRNPDAAADLQDAYKAIDNALENASTGYRLANDEFARRSRVIDALQGGQGMARPSSRSADVGADFARLTPEEQAAARLGYGDTLLRQVEGGTEGANKARPFTSQKRQADIGAIAADPDKLKRQIGREQTMFETRRQATGGSLTADNQQDLADAMGQNANAVVNLLSGRFGAAAQQIGGTVMRAATGSTPETRNIIARALLSDNPKRALAIALRNKQISARQRNMIERALTGGATVSAAP